MRYKITIETDFIGNRETFKRSLHIDEIQRAISGEIVYLAFEEVTQNVIIEDKT